MVIHLEAFRKKLSTSCHEFVLYVSKMKRVVGKSSLKTEEKLENHEHLYK